MHVSPHTRAGALAALGLLGLWPAADARAASPLDPPRQYRVYGTADVTIDGPHCCTGSLLTGQFEAAYDVESSGAATLRDLSLELADATVVVHGGFLDLFSERIWLRCATANLTAHAHGTLAAADRIKFPAGTVALSAMSAETREADGSCPEPSLVFAGGTNSDVVVVTHKPDENHVDLDATLTIVAEGSPYAMHVTGTGAFANRPPQAALAFRLPDGSVPQGGCPAFPFWNGQAWETVAEANGPAGLTASLLSYSSDPDGTWSAADVLQDLWFDTRGSGDRLPLAAGRSAGPFVFGWGADHDVQLLALDHESAGSVATCHFKVADTKPPLVHAPSPLVTGCSTTGGATRATSPTLNAFLNAATATDVVDPTPTALAPQTGGVDVTPTTLFPANGVARTVRFRFTDDAGRIGIADSTVTVRDVIPPTVAVAASPASIPPTMAFYSIVATPTATDACGGPFTYRLKSIISNAPALDASDIAGAAYNTDDRSFMLRGRPAAPGVARVYKITYQAIDAAGNVGSNSTVVTVPAL